VRSGFYGTVFGGCCRTKTRCAIRLTMTIPLKSRVPGTIVNGNRFSAHKATVELRTMSWITKPGRIYNRGSPILCVETVVNMKKTIAIVTLAALGITTLNAGVHVGINFGIPIPVPVVTTPVPVVVTPAPVVVPTPMPAPFVEVAPACPTPGFIWVGGSWAWCDNHWLWTRGHWGPPAHWGYAYHGGYHRDFHGGHYGGHHNGHGHR
jgi:hypothetical protein